MRTVSAIRLRGIEGEVGLLEKLTGVGLRAGCCEAATGRNAKRLPFERSFGLLDDFAHSLDREPRFRFIADGKDDCEFFTPESAH